MSKYNFGSSSTFKGHNSKGKYQQEEDEDSNEDMSLVDLNWSLTESLSQTSESAKTSSKEPGVDSTASKSPSAKRKLAMSQSITSLNEEAIARNQTKKKSRNEDDVEEADEHDPDGHLDQAASADANGQEAQKPAENPETPIRNWSNIDGTPLKKTPDSTNRRINIHKIIRNTQLSRETRQAHREEAGRTERREKRQILEAEIEKNMTDKELAKTFCLDYDLETKKPLIVVDRRITKNLKTHQREGVKFMWDCCFESCEDVANDHRGGGCLLAHCMGLGKTLQAITLVHTVLAHEKETTIKRVLILMPKNVTLNWHSEFTKWTSKCDKKVKIFEMPYDLEESNELTVTKARLATVSKWFKNGGVLLMGYTLFTNIVQAKSSTEAEQLEFNEYLLEPGADLVVCDEGHLIKSAETSLSASVNKIATKRRIVLTGTPLQNNLGEYYQMVSFIKPHLLGTLKEFNNQFVNPIINGQHRDSTPGDVFLMKKRAHVLHDLLAGCVQRKDYSVIQKLLPKKHEYVLSVRLSEKQCELYHAYLVGQRGIGKLDDVEKIIGMQLFLDFAQLMRIWTHPYCLKMKENELRHMVDGNGVPSPALKQKAKKGSLQAKSINLMVESDEDDDDLAKSSISKINKARVNGGASTQIVNFKNLIEVNRRLCTLLTADCQYDMSMSGKLMLFKQILDKCEECGDKLLVFSQSLMALDIIEKFLNRTKLSNKARGNTTWKLDRDYFRLDGQTDSDKRQVDINKFNDPDEYDCRLYLISTKAGGIGINLVGANRCIIFDHAWNPSLDTQSVFRIYRFGQTKEVFVYRFLAQGTMEEKIYQRQIAKISLSQRVIDEHQLDRHFTMQELKELYAFQPDIWNPNKKRNLPIPDDLVLRQIILESSRWISKIHEHDSLLENRLDEGLSPEEMDAAWQEFEKDTKENKVTYLKESPVLNAQLVQKICAGCHKLYLGPSLDDDSDDEDEEKFDPMLCETCKIQKTVQAAFKVNKENTPQSAKKVLTAKKQPHQKL